MGGNDTTSADSKGKVPTKEAVLPKEASTPPTESTIVQAPHPVSVPDLLTALYRLRETNPKAVRNTTFPYPVELYDNGEGSSTGQQRDRRITSWKMTEHMYFKSRNIFPTLARGLFTEEIEEGDEVPSSLVGVEPRTIWAEDMDQEEEDNEETEKGDDSLEDQPSAPKKRRMKQVGVVKERIVARGYDKFFNIDEVPWTYWEAMKKYSEGPYHLTLKSNGCLILISALSPSHLLVASKHSLGTRSEQDISVVEPPKDAKKGKSRSEPEADSEEAEDRSHAAVGREWVKRTLRAKGKSEIELARKLWDQNLSAVLELCDDSFEEHVIATPEYWTGLHLHGLNHNTPRFSTLPPDEVTSFAEEFGFIPTKTVKLDTLEEVKSFTDDVAKTGSWEGDMIEGFVVRSTVRDAGDDTDEDQPPYLPGAPFFFKVKFDEPYLLYRQWREMTRFMLPLLDGDIPDKKIDEIWEGVKKRIKRPEVALYADWVGRTVKTDPALFEDFGRKVVRVRDCFLRWTEGDGAKEWQAAKDNKYKLIGGPETVEQKRQREMKDAAMKKRDEERKALLPSLPKKWILVPCSVPGTGKTLVGLTLSKLFGFAHTQSDDVTTKKSAPGFLNNITTLLKKHDVVYADRNNHIDKHYKELAELHNKKELLPYNVRLIGIVWDVEKQPVWRVIRLCSERIVTRGENHQTLRPDPNAEAEHEAIVNKFLRDFTSPDESLFDGIVDVSLTDTPHQVVRHIASALTETLNLSPVDDSLIESALEDAKAYRTTTPYHPPDKASKTIRYFGLAPEIDIVGVIEVGIMYSNPEYAQPANRFLGALQASKRVITSPHITLVHNLSIAAEKESLGEGGIQSRAWEECIQLASQTKSVLWEFEMTHLVWDKRVMAVVVENLRPPNTTGIESLAELVKEEVEEGMHITVGTKHEEIRPYEARPLVEMVRKRILAGETEGEADELVEGGGKVMWARLGPIPGEGRVKGMW